MMRKNIRRTAAYFLAVVLAGSLSNTFVQTKTTEKYDGNSVYAEENSNTDKGPTLTAEIKEKKTYLPGDTFIMQIRVTDNEEGYNALRSNISFDPSVLEVVEWNGGDPEEENYKKTPQNIDTICYFLKNENEEITAINQLYFDSSAENLKGDNIFSTVTFKIKESAKQGTCKIEIIPSDKSNTMGNRVLQKEKTEILVIEPEYFGTEIEIVSGENSVTETTVTTADETDKTDITAPAETTAAENTETTDVSEAAMANIIGDINSDGVVNSEDVKILTECLLKIKNSSEYKYIDINADKEITIMDLIRLKSIILNALEEK